MATASKSAQMDAKAKKKLIFASALLLVAVVWIIYYMTSLGGGKTSGPSLSEAEKQVLEEQHQQELKAVTEETNSPYRGGRPPLPPSGS